MSRNQWMEGITLHSRRFQEYHKQVVLLSRDGGIREAVLHGGYKGRSRHAGTTEPFRHVKLLLYHNPVRDSWKITDGEVLHPFEGFRGSLPRIYLATLWGEILIRTRGGGMGEEGEELFRMVLDCLSLLETAAPEKLVRLNVQFLWRFLACTGFAPDVSRCASCGRTWDEAAGREPLRAVYDTREQGFLCGTCGPAGGASAGGSGDYLPGSRILLSPGVPRYLDFSLSREVAQGLRASLPPEELALLEKLAMDFLAAEMELRPKTPDYRGFL